MSRRTRSCRALALGVILAGSTFLVVSRPRVADAQTTHCYLVACTGNVCVWQEIPCPKSAPEKPPEV